MRKVTVEMIEYWLGNCERSEILKDYKDIANGEYTPKDLKDDILSTWGMKK